MQSSPSPTRLDSPAADVDGPSLSLRRPLPQPHTVAECAEVRVQSCTAQVPVASVSAAAVLPPGPHLRHRVERLFDLGLALLVSCSRPGYKERDDAERERPKVAAPHAAQSGRIDPPPSPPSSVHNDHADPRPAQRRQLVAHSTARSAQRNSDRIDIGAGCPLRRLANTTHLIDALVARSRPALAPLAPPSPSARVQSPQRFRSTDSSCAGCLLRFSLARAQPLPLAHFSSPSWLRPGCGPCLEALDD